MKARTEVQALSRIRADEVSSEDFSQYRLDRPHPRRHLSNQQPLHTNHISHHILEHKPPSTLPTSACPKQQEVKRPALTLPTRRPKRLPRIKQNPNRIPIRLKRTSRNIIPPPTRGLLTRKLERQENHNRRNRQSAIQSGASDVIVVRPPAPILVLQILIKNKAHNGPGGIIDGAGGRDLARTAEDKRHVDVAEVGSWEGACETVKDEGGDGAGEEEPEQVAVELAGGENAGGADETPDDGGGEEDAAVGALEVVLVVGGADVFDVSEGPVEDADLHEAGPDGGDHLAREEHARRHFHVVAEFEVGGEGQSLGHGDVAVGFEEHHGDWPARLHVADDEFRDDVEAELHVCDGLNHADGDHEDEGDE